MGIISAFGAGNDQDWLFNQMQPYIDAQQAIESRLQKAKVWKTVANIPTGMADGAHNMDTYFGGIIAYNYEDPPNFRITVRDNRNGRDTMYPLTFTTGYAMSPVFTSTHEYLNNGNPVHVVQHFQVVGPNVAVTTKATSTTWYQVPNIFVIMKIEREVEL